MYFNIYLFAILAVLSGVKSILTPNIEKFFGGTADTYDWSKHPCRRPCVDGGKPMKCEYVFVVESFVTMSKACYNCPYNMTDCFRPHCIPADGLEKVVKVANRLLPGPSIEVCKGDQIEVDVRNALLEANTVIHWHGIHQEHTPYMDGVAYVSQCPILPGHDFHYSFNASTSGTYFWHSHMSGGQRCNGLFGNLIIRSAPKDNPLKDLYDYDNNTMIITEWNRLSEEDFYSTATQKEPIPYYTILINGLGRYKNFANDSQTAIYTPTATFEVKKGFRYRFRFINAGAECPIQVSIDNHTMQLISADGKDIEPFTVDSFYSWPGERFDFIIHVNQTIDNYWIRYRGHTFLCQDIVYQTAILRYESADIVDPKGPVAWSIPDNSQFNRILYPPEANQTSNIVPFVEMKSLEKNDEVLLREPDQRIYMSLGFNILDNYECNRRGLYGWKQVPIKNACITPHIDYITFKFPLFPFLSQRDMLRPEMVCNSSDLVGRNCLVDQCICSHMLQVKLNSLVEIVIVEKVGQTGDVIHPQHLHGFSFRVVGSGVLNQTSSVELVKELDRKGELKRVLDKAPLKDTVAVPDNGYVIIRFLANNPGYWFYHCHIEQHVDQGMALVFKVGENDEMPPVPPHFPKC